MSEETAPTNRPVAPPPAAADVGIVAALPVEIGHFIGQLKDVRRYAAGRYSIAEGACGERVVVLVASGPGRAAARRGAELLLAGHRPRWLISAGFAGALTHELPRNTVVLPNEIVDTAGTRVGVDVHVPSEIPGGRVRAARLATVDEIVRTAAEKAELRARTGADAVDMESLELALLCAERSLRFVCVRVVSDDAQTDLPPEVLTLVGPTGGYRVGAAVGALLKRPTRLGVMLRLREHAQQAARRLSAFLVPFVRDSLR